jgi:hypothetical protein
LGIQETTAKRVDCGGEIAALKGVDKKAWTKKAWTSMIGNSQGETEIPLDLAEGVLPTGNAFA